MKIELIEPTKSNNPEHPTCITWNVNTSQTSMSSLEAMLNTHNTPLHWLLPRNQIPKNQNIKYLDKLFPNHNLIHGGTHTLTNYFCWCQLHYTPTRGVMLAIHHKYHTKSQCKHLQIPTQNTLDMQIILIHNKPRSPLLIVHTYMPSYP